MGQIAQAVKKYFREVMDHGTVTLDGVKVITDKNLVGDVARAEILAGTYERSERNLVRQALAPEDRVLEFGGCLGLLSLLCAKIVGAENVLCYEPNPAACRVIELNYSMNDLKPELRQKAITENGGPVDIYLTENMMSSSLYERDTAGAMARVESDAFRDVLAEWKPTAIVVDIEGAECEVLPSADLVGVQKIIIETHAKIVGEDRTRDLMRLLERAGFVQRAVKSRRIFLSR